ncbi:hypothetical protein FOL47_005992 [Perkinsus chesapeaki]|uniref:Uncharacterized protein n=1 Tax=Perkinsus chesapeaki TaxID=330153 RepID=A0A7J6LUI6_PERCH|nr:hypothetical protein FOL47_005992 [Perkinsus chesapeaki]
MTGASSASKKIRGVINASAALRQPNSSATKGRLEQPAASEAVSSTAVEPSSVVRGQERSMASSLAATMLQTSPFVDNSVAMPSEEGIPAMPRRQPKEKVKSTPEKHIAPGGYSTPPKIPREVESPPWLPRKRAGSVEWTTDADEDPRDQESFPTYRFYSFDEPPYGSQVTDFISSAFGAPRKLQF